MLQLHQKILGVLNCESPELSINWKTRHEIAEILGEPLEDVTTALHRLIQIKDVEAKALGLDAPVTISLKGQLQL
jgi:hypothetical protein